MAVLGVEARHVVLLCRKDGDSPPAPVPALVVPGLPCTPAHQAQSARAWTGHTAFVTEETSVSFVGNWGPHLVVVRSCNILKWELEVRRWCRGSKTLLYVGSHRELKAKRQVCYFKHEKE